MSPFFNKNEIVLLEIEERTFASFSFFFNLLLNPVSDANWAKYNTFLRIIAINKYGFVMKEEA